jgi:hypothetical protein
VTTSPSWGDGINDANVLHQADGGISVDAAVDVAAGASLFLPFLPMLPSQILLDNFLYDCSELTIPSDNVDEELLAGPSTGMSDSSASWSLSARSAPSTTFSPSP